MIVAAPAQAGIPARVASWRLHSRCGACGNLARLALTYRALVARAHEYLASPHPPALRDLTRAWQEIANLTRPGQGNGWRFFKDKVRELAWEVAHNSRPVLGGAEPSGPFELRSEPGDYMLPETEADVLAETLGQLGLGEDGQYVVATLVRPGTSTRARSRSLSSGARRRLPGTLPKVSRRWRTTGVHRAGSPPPAFAPGPHRSRSARKGTTVPPKTVARLLGIGRQGIGDSDALRRQMNRDARAKRAGGTRWRAVPEWRKTLLRGRVHRAYEPWAVERAKILKCAEKRQQRSLSRRAAESARTARADLVKRFAAQGPPAAPAKS